ncbi:MAG: hypothetical protein PUC06_01450 [Oscillospiraceae bacterium]|nr:hypothetical protein [Oscillospiraceae bacterium]
MAQKKPEFSDRSKDANVMTSTDFSFMRRFWYASVKITAVYLIYVILTSQFSLPLAAEYFVSFVLLILWIYFNYTDIYRAAMRDYNLVKYQYIQYDPLRGLKTGLKAQIPGVVLVLLMCILSLGSGTWSDLCGVLWIVFYSPFVTFVGAMKSLISTSVWGYAPFYLIPMLFQPVIGYLAYKNGYNNIGIFYKLIYKSRDKDKRLR